MEKIHHYPHVFSPIRVGNLTLKNRIQFSPTVSCMSTAYGEVTTEYVDFIGMQARTGCALITIGATSVDEDTGTDFAGELNITRDEMIGGLSRIADMAHRYGAKISAEMCHSGRGAEPTLLRTPYALAPTPIPLEDKCRYVKEMDQQEIDHVVSQYADCAERLYKAGFDMCMIHGAHGNLIGQFLSPLTNHRTDRYGGSPENRWRFALEIMEAMRARLGSKMAIELRISGDEMHPEGMHIDDTVAFLRQAQRYVDMVVVSRGLIVDKNYNFYCQPPYYHPYCHNVYLSEPIKKALDIPVSVVGSIKNCDMAEEILAAGKADVVAMARGLFADPDMLHKARRTGSQQTVKPCLRCLQVCNNNTDYGRPTCCAITPELGIEKYAQIQPAPVKKKAVIVGGGVAGMMAAQTLRKRGHEVVLFEQKDHLGGHLVDICHLPFKDDMRQYARWDVEETMNCGADIRLNTKATAELVYNEHPDLVYLATGSRLFTPRIPGIDRDNVKDVITVDKRACPIGQRVVVCGGGMSGLECALALAMEGKDVTVVDMIPAGDFAKEIVHYTRDMLMMLLKKHNVRLVGDSNVREITDEGVVVMDRNWKCTTFPADTVVTAFGMRSNNDDFEDLLYLCPDTYVIGDAGDGVKNIPNANYTAFHSTVIQ